MKRFMLTAFLPISIFFLTAFNSVTVLNCGVPENVAVSSINGGNISLDWDDCTESCTEYGVHFIRQEDDFTSQEYLTSNSSISFQNLPDGTYDFYLVTICGTDRSSYVVVEETIVN